MADVIPSSHLHTSSQSFLVIWKKVNNKEKENIIYKKN